MNKTTLSTLANAPIPIASMTEMHLVMGRQCNIRCSFCYQESFSPKDDLSDEIVTDLLPHTKHLDRLIIQGGEPTVMKCCKKMRDYLAKTQFDGRLCFLTNGVLFGDEWIDFLINRKADAHFSINASCKEVYDKIIKYGNFDAVVQNLSKLVEQKKLRGQIEPRIGVSFVIFEDNMWDILNFVKLVYNIGVQGCSFYMDCRYEGRKLFKDMPDEELEAYHALVLETMTYMNQIGFGPSELATIDHLILDIKNERTEQKTEGLIAI